MVSRDKGGVLRFKPIHGLSRVTYLAKPLRDRAKNRRFLRFGICLFAG